MVLGFMLVWDMPSIKQGVATLARYGCEVYAGGAVGRQKGTDGTCYPHILCLVPSFSSRLAPVYNEVAPVFGVFGRLFGKALEVQVGICCVMFEVRGVAQCGCGHVMAMPLWMT